MPSPSVDLTSYFDFGDARMRVSISIESTIPERVGEEEDVVIADRLWLIAILASRSAASLGGLSLEKLSELHARFITAHPSSEERGGR